MAGTVTLPDDLQIRLDAIAHEDGKTVPEIIREAAERYIAHRDLDQLSARGAARSEGLGLRPADIERLIHETRKRSDARHPRQ